MHCNMAPKVAFLACSIIVFLMEAPSAKAAVEEVDNAPSSTEELKMRAKRQLVGTPNIPLMDPKRKRPFCNAFTGCGKKRSEGASRLGALEKMAQLTEGDLGDQSGMSESESLATLVELNSEPAVAELSRQILSEAKLWEAIQEARQEMSRRRQQLTERQPRGRPNPIELTGIRKRREAPATPPAIPKGTLPSAGNGALPIV